MTIMQLDNCCPNAIPQEDPQAGGMYQAATYDRSETNAQETQPACKRNNTIIKFSG